MVFYRRNHVAGVTYFFTVNLRDHQKMLLVDHVDVFRALIRGVRIEIPFVINAMVIFIEFLVH